jgi:hypothetical protein
MVVRLHVLRFQSTVKNYSFQAAPRTLVATVEHTELERLL